MSVKRSSHLNKLLALLLAALLGFGNLPLGAQTVYADDSDDGLYAEFTDIRYTSPDGSPLPNPIEDDAAIKIEFDWHVVDTTTGGAIVTTGGAITPTGVLEDLVYDFPSIIDLGTSDIGGNLAGDNGQSYGSYYIDVSAKKLILSFNDNAATQSVVNGTVVLNRTIDISDTTVTTPYTFSVPIDGGPDKTYTLYIVPQDGAALEKSADAVAVGNDKSVTYTLDINTNLNDYSTAVSVTDILDAPLVYDQSSFSLYELTVQSDGQHTTTGSDLYDASQMTIDQAAGSFNYQLGAIGQKAYRLTYNAVIDQTAVDQSASDITIDNTANFEDASDTTTVTYTPADMITKSGKADVYYNGKEITWTVTINQPGYALTNAVLSDQIPNGLTLDTSSIEVYVDDQPYTDYSDNSAADQLNLTFAALSQPVTIVYTTTSDYSAATDSARVKSYTNEAALSYDGLPSGQTITDSATVALKYGSTLHKALPSTSVGYGDEKYLNHKIFVNSARDHLGHAVLKDQLSAGTHYFDEDSLVIRRTTIDANGKHSLSEILELGKHYTVSYGTTGDIDQNPDDMQPGSYVADQNSFMMITFKETVDKNTSYRVTYKSIIQQNEDGQYDRSYDNDATLWYMPTGTGEGPGDGTDTGAGTGQQDWKSITLNNPVSRQVNIVNSLQKFVRDFESNNWRQGSNATNISGQNFKYNDDGTVSLWWLLKANLKENPVEGLSFSDTFGGGLYMTQDQLDNIAVRKSLVNYNTSTPVDGSVYTVVPTVTDGKIKGFTLTFNETVQDAIYYVDFYTDVDPDQIPSVDDTGEASWVNYRNTATASSTNNEINRKAATTPKVDGYNKTEGFKQAQWLDDTKKDIVWTVNLNYLNKTLPAGYTVSDTIVGNQVYNEDISFFSYDLDSTGQVINVTPLASAPSQIDVVYDDTTKVLQLVLNAEYSERIGFRYTTTRQGLAQYQYSNTATANGIELTATIDYQDNTEPLYIDKQTVGAIGYDATLKQNYINYKVSLNSGQSTIDDLTVTDTLDQGMSIDLTSVSIVDAEDQSYRALFDVAETGSTGEGKRIYSFTLKDGQSFEEELFLNYRVYINQDEVQAVNGKASLANSIEFSGSYAEQGTTTETSQTKTVFLTSSATGTGQTGSFTVYKRDTDTDQLLGGVSFALYKNGAYMGIVKTIDDQDDAAYGSFTRQNLKYGNYSLQEVSPLEGYQLASDQVAQISFTLTADDPNTNQDESNQQFTVYNELQRRVQIVKRDAESDVLLSGAAYQISQDGQVVATLTTDANGQATSGVLAKGEYTITEISAPSGYYLDETAQTITIDGNSPALQSVSFNNEIKRHIKLLKVSDSDPNSGLSGVVFGLYYNENGQKGALYQRFSATDSDGVTILEEVPKGDYFIDEISGAEGHYPLAEPIAITIDQDSPVQNYQVISNELVRGIQIVKVDADNNQVYLPGAVFKLTNTDSGNSEILTTDQYGTIDQVLSQGNYTLTELQAPEGYFNSGYETSFTIDTSVNQTLQFVVQNEALHNIIIYKRDVDTEASLAGAVFDIYQQAANTDDGEDKQSATLVATLTTDQDGLAISQPLAEGVYRIEERTAPDGYFNNMESQLVTITADGDNSVSVTFYNEKQRDVQIRKIAARSTEDQTIGLAGAEFDLYEATTGTRLNETPLVTDEDGYIGYSPLAKGSYYVVETKAPTGYYDDTVAQHNFEVTARKDSYQIVVENELRRSIRIYKVSDADPTTGLAGAVFGLYDEEDNLIATFPETNANGYAQLDDIAQGDYYIKEISAPNNHYLIDQARQVVIDQTSPAITQEDFTNELMRGIRIVKVDADNQAVFLSGASFDIVDQAGNTVNVVTNEAGTANAILAQGSYTITEVSAPDGYFNSDYQQTITIDTSVNDTLELTVTNQRERTLNIKKVSASNPDTVLAGAVFTVKDQNDNTVADNLVTDATGYATLTGLASGEYYISEVSAPSGYQLNDTVYYIDVSGDQTVFEVVVSNQPVTGGNNNVDTPDTDTDTDTDTVTVIEDGDTPLDGNVDTDTDPDTVIEDGGIPLDGGNTPSEDTSKDENTIADGDIPLGGNTLPQTDDVTSPLTIIGIALMAIGAWLLIKRKITARWNA